MLLTLEPLFIFLLCYQFFRIFNIENNSQSIINLPELAARDFFPFDYIKDRLNNDDNLVSLYSEICKIPRK